MAHGRGAYIGKRLIGAVVTIFVVITVIFFLQKALPGDPFAQLARNPRMDPAAVEQVRAEFGVGEPVWKQYLKYMNNVLHGNLGISTFNLQPVGPPAMGEVEDHRADGDARRDLRHRLRDHDWGRGRHPAANGVRLRIHGNGAHLLLVPDPVVRPDADPHLRHDAGVVPHRRPPGLLRRPPRLGHTSWTRSGTWSCHRSRSVW